MNTLDEIAAEFVEDYRAAIDPETTASGWLSLYSLDEVRQGYWQAVRAGDIPEDMDYIIRVMDAHHTAGGRV